MARLSMKNISVTIQHKNILQDISLSFPEGKITAILGPNGCGKSTLLRIATGFSHDYQGQVTLDDKLLRDLSAKTIARKIAVLPQTVSVPPDLTVRQLVAYGRFPYKNLFSNNNADDNKIINWAMQQTSIVNLEQRQLTTLSGGERQRAWITMALCQQPEILILDEPTTYLDIEHQLEIMQIIKMLNEKQQITVVMVLHDINHARMYADKVVIIDKHTIAAQGDPYKILSVELLDRVFNVKAMLYQNKENEINQEIIFPIALSHDK
ncbi:ABC transporter ATP-binding protein [Pectinatus sottacetonis]|uniref:ABC transporter ATP-binding protein n=1 Tax=Pectinatus sottacetonis TaxID=1002795 RepID=UPI0018C4EC0C|nr:ABC transporter ATP-binding protein [Pectinatus sottacetonis]